MQFPTKTLERMLFAKGHTSVIGVDEVGMGCLAGPVVVCAVAVSRDFYKKQHRALNGIRDSKLLSPKQRETVALAIQKSGVRFQISLCYPKTIDKINIYQASRKAMQRAVQKLLASSFQLSEKNSALKANTYNLKPAIVLVDGPHTIAGLDLPQRAIVKGDRTVFAIACASVIAKVYRDRMMIRYAKHFPEYGFEKHKGYGTKLHVAMLAQYGPSAIHRHSFAPVGQML